MYRPIHEDTLARMFVLYGALGARLRQLGHETKSLRYIDDEYGVFDVTVDDNGYSSKSRKLRVQVSGDKKVQFPEPRNGFNVDKIAGVISAEIHRRKEQQKQQKKMRDQDRTHNEVFRIICQEYGFSMMMGMVFGDFQMQANSQGFRVEFKKTFRTEAEFRDFLTKAQAAGLISRPDPEAEV